MIVEVLVYVLALLLTGFASAYGFIAFLNPERIDSFWICIHSKVETKRHIYAIVRFFEDIVRYLPPSTRRQFFPYWRENDFGFLRMGGLITVIVAGLIFIGLLASLVVPLIYRLLH